MGDPGRERSETHPPAGVPDPPAVGHGESRWLTPIVLLLTILYVASQYPYTLFLPFAGDDFVFLERVKNANFISLWQAPEGSDTVLGVHYYRPVSRELHFWTLTRLFGQWEPPFHLLSMALSITIALLYFILLRNIGGPALAATATSAVLTLAAWGVLIVWASGSQDLWMIVFVLLSLIALTRGRTWLAWLGFALALLSKETAATVPVIATAYLLTIERRTLRSALRRTAGMWVVLAVWAAFHPLVGGQIRTPIHDPVLPGTRHTLPWIFAHNLLAVVNLEEWPKPLRGWAFVLGRGMIGALLVAVLATTGLGRWWRPQSPAPPVRLPAGRIAAWGAIWALLGWAPLLLPALEWHAYYALFGMLGVWVSAAALLIRWPRVAIAMVAALAFVRAGRSDTKSSDWGAEWFQRRAAMFGRETHDYFLRHYPSLPAHTRIYVSRVPPNVGLVPGGNSSPAFRVWYDDSTLGTYYSSYYRPRRPDEPQGEDYLFVYDSTDGWRREPIVARPQNPTPAQRDAYARFMWQMTQFATARAEYETLVALDPKRWDYAFNLGSSILMEGDSAGAAEWYLRAAALPGAPPEIVRSAERSRRHLRR